MNLLYRPTAPQVSGLNEPTQAILNELWAQWVAKQPRNILRNLYLDAKAQFKDLEVSLPPHLVEKLNIVFGWPEKAVYEIANRVVLEGLVTEDGNQDPFDLSQVLRANRFWTEFQSATVSSVAQSVVFMSVTPGIKERGEPEQLLMFHSALHATGLWDKRIRGLSAGLLINKVNSLGSPTLVTLMLPTISYVIGWIEEVSTWQALYDIPNPVGRMTLRALPYRPNLDRPFGKSKIDRPTMSMTDRGVRAAGRLEIHSELFMNLKLMLMGVGENTFKDSEGNTIPLWSFVMGRLNGIPKDEDGDVPTLETITAQSPEPHISALREIASEFSGHSGVPLSNLGVSAANPESAQSKTIARDDTVSDAERCQMVFGEELRLGLEDMVALREGWRWQRASEEMRNLSLLWRRPDRPTLAALADAGAKQVAAIPGLAETQTGMRMVGLSPFEIQSAQVEMRQAKSRSLLDSLQGVSDSGAEQEESESVPESTR